MPAPAATPYLNSAAMGVDLWKSSDGVVEVDVHCCFWLLSAGCTEFAIQNFCLMSTVGAAMLISDF
jgi:hypothetical protein